MIVLRAFKGILFQFDAGRFSLEFDSAPINQVTKRSMVLMSQGRPFVVDVRCGKDYTTPVTPWSHAAQEWMDNHHY
jgi:hypothetical protein